ncbi:endonuclease domain-containing protein [Agromyces agglutinans]|nr:DUF559 domain-containing protein [Agromyces agglutinans]
MSHSPNAVARCIRSHGGALAYRHLDAYGIPRQAVTRARSAGAIVQVRQRWFAVPDAPPDVVRAVRVGGSLTGASVARLEGVWTRREATLHVRVPRTASRLRAPDGSGRRLDVARDRVCVHYRTVDGVIGARDPLALALAELAACAPRLDAHIAVDSALAERQLDTAGLAELRTLLVPTRRSIVDLADAGCQSGTETIVRMLLLGHRIRHRTQVTIDGVGRIDVLVGERLVIEIDGAGFHTGPEFERDRRRDFELVMGGYLVLRLSYEMVVSEWDSVQEGILELVRRGEHRWGVRATARPRAAGVSVARGHIDPGF